MTKDELKAKAAELDLLADGIADKVLAKLIASGHSGSIVAVVLLAAFVAGMVAWAWIS
jgi:hypothetical protein